MILSVTDIVLLEKMILRLYLSIFKQKVFGNTRSILGLLSCNFLLNQTLLIFN